MASEPMVGGASGGGDGVREKHRWSESKVYTRKSHNKKNKATNPSCATNPPQPSSQLTPTTVDAHSFQQPPPPPVAAAAASTPSDDDASSLNHHRQTDALVPNNHRHYHQPHNGHNRSMTISLASRSRHELRDIRRKLTADLEKIRNLSRKLDARDLQLASAATSAPEAPRYTLSQFSENDPNTPVGSKRAPPFSNSEAASLRRMLNVSVPAGESSGIEALEKEKRTPKANQYYRNSDFILAKDRLPPSESHSHKKSKSKGSKKGEFDYIASQSADRKLYAQAFRSCSSLLSKLMKHRHAWVFNTPVDVKGLGLLDYHTIIKEPMDLGTVKSRLGKNWYKSPREFAEDVRLTFRNAMVYNPKGQDVHIMAEQLLQVFEDRWPTIEAEYMTISYPPPHKKPPSHITPPFVDTRSLERSDSTVNPASDSRAKTLNTQNVTRTSAMKKPKAKDLHKRDMTFEEKQKLSNNLQSLPSEKLDMVVQIIKKRNSSLSQNDDEIEVDIDSVDVETLWELDRFVTNYKKSLSKNRRKAELAILARAEAEQTSLERVRETVPEAVVTGGSKENKIANEKGLASSSPAIGDKRRDHASGSNSSSSSGSGSSSSDSDSDSYSSSAYGSDAGHSPKE